MLRHTSAVGSGDAEALEAGRASPKAEHIGTSRASLLGPLQKPSALTGIQLGEVLDSLRELGSVHMNLGLLQRSGVLRFADGLTQCSVSSACHTIAEACYCCRPWHLRYVPLCGSCRSVDAWPCMMHMCMTVLDS